MTGKHEQEKPPSEPWSEAKRVWVNTAALVGTSQAADLVHAFIAAKFEREAATNVIHEAGGEG